MTKHRLNTVMMRVPVEFEQFVRGHAQEFSRQTGMPVNMSATMRRMGTKLNKRLLTKGLGFDWRIF